MDLTVQLLPVSAVVPAGHRIRVAMAGHDASCFTRYGPAEETFTLELGSDSHLDLPVRGMNAGRPELDPRVAGDVGAALERTAGSSAPVAAVRNLGA
jgi:hypothetical protein